TITLPQQERQNQYTIEDTSPRSVQSLTHNHLLFLNMMNNKKDESNKENDHIVDVHFNRLNGQQQRKQPRYQRRHKQILTTGLKAEHDGLNKDFLKLPSRPPYFDFGMPRNITARSGQTAAITCRVENLGDKSVSWIRKRDLHILTAGILTYTSDERFKVKKREKVIRTGGSKNWSLHIRYAQPRDSGIYECQVNTEPKISMAFRLNVVVTPPDAKAFISGPMDLYVKVGSAITLTCHVKQPSSMHDIGPIHWYRGPYILTPFAVHPNDAAIDMQRISMESKLGDKLQSRLRISNVQLADTGNYTCMPTTAELASVTVNVINEINNNNKNEMNADIENANEDTTEENDNEKNPEITSSKQVLLTINGSIDWPKINETTAQTLQDQSQKTFT
uniref:Ig-like domain-containing protein n=1 Tax=Glossina morsitans morsitans TaxID=37546 RepID=A0A1B0FEW4_GLOMM